MFDMRPSRPCPTGPDQAAGSSSLSSQGRGKRRRTAFQALLWGLYATLVLAVALVQQGPGYMDAAYYATLGRRLAHGYGLTEPFLWTYVNDPGPPPRPGHDYWQPMASLLAAAGEAFLRGVLPSPYRRVQAAFVLLALLVPAVTYGLARNLTGREAPARWALLLSLAPVFFLPYLPAVDGFAPLMVLGGLFFLTLPRAGTFPRALLLGGLAGLIHLTRNEGPLWLAAALAGAGTAARPRSRAWLGVLMGYVAVLGPWWARNLQAFGTPWPGFAVRLLWMTHYNDLFLYPPDLLTPERWWAAGPRAWWGPRVQAFSWNVQTLVAVQGGLVWIPWLLWGAWRYRRDVRVRVGLGLWAALFALMTLVFPFAGARGGFFHGVAGLQPLVWSLAAVGLHEFFIWGEKRREWHPQQARGVLGGGLVLLALALTLLVASRRLATWNRPSIAYQRAATWMAAQGLPPRACPVMVNDPPMWSWSTGGAALVVPAGGVHAVEAVARRYGACALLLEPNHPSELAPWYARPGDWEHFRYMGSMETEDGVIHVFRYEK